MLQMGKELMQVKDVFYEILEAEPPEGDEVVKANQKLGLSLTKAVEEKALLIFQNQTQHVQKNVIAISIKGMKLIDKLLVQNPALMQKQEPKALVKAEVVDGKKIILELAEDGKDPIAECCKKFIDKEIPWKKFTHIMQMYYLQAGIKKWGTQAKVADTLGVQRSYLSKLKSDFKEEGQLPEMKD